MLLCGPFSDAFGSGDVSDLPREVRGYKVEYAKVEFKAVRGNPASDLITFSDARLAVVGPLEVVFEVRVTIAPVGHSGKIERLVFDDISVNGVPAVVDDYEHKFSLPKDEPLTLPGFLRLRVSSPGALLGAVREIIDPQERWPVKGRVYACGRYKRFFMSFKRAVPVDVSTFITNPM